MHLNHPLSWTGAIGIFLGALSTLILPDWIGISIVILAIIVLAIGLIIQGG